MAHQASAKTERGISARNRKGFGDTWIIAYSGLTDKNTNREKSMIA